MDTTNGSSSKDQESSANGLSGSKGKQKEHSTSDKDGEKGQGANLNVDGVLSATVDENSNEWRNSHGNQGGTSSDHFEPSTSFAEEDDDGVRPSELYGKFTWKIENFSEISKRELRSNVFEVGEYKWYILVYPQGCDVSNHLSLFLCVADYDKLLPGWSHFAQFTIAVVNKDPKKSKYSDTLHRFCKKEHDWGWKKFMELSKVLDGFTVSDTLVIKAQVQVIREKQNRPFRCLDTQYRRELVRVYLTNVEGICRRFLEERREKLSKLKECPEAFHEFWDSLSPQLRTCLASDRADNILKLLVKRFFNEKEVTSTLVMDALHSGYKALEVDQHSSNGESSELPVSISMDQNLTYLTGDVMKSLEAAAKESTPQQNEDKDLDDYGKDSVERDERRLAELGRQAIEMFVLSHLYINRIEVAFKENEALKRQEALIREEEEAERLEEERILKKAEAERERRNRRKEKKQRKKEKKEAEEAAAEAERKAAEELKKKHEEEARKQREEAAEKERLAREAEREAARQAAKEKEAAKKAAKKAAQEEAKKQSEKEASDNEAAKERAQASEKEKEKEKASPAPETADGQLLREKDERIAQLNKTLEDMQLTIDEKDATISKLQSELQKAKEILQQIVQQKQGKEELANVALRQNISSPPSTPDNKLPHNGEQIRAGGPRGSEPSRRDGLPVETAAVAPVSPEQSGMNIPSPMKAYGSTNRSFIPKGFPPGPNIPNGSGNGPLRHISGMEIPNGMASYVSGTQGNSQQPIPARGLNVAQNVAGGENDKGGNVMNGTKDYVHMMMRHGTLQGQGNFGLTSNTQQAPNHSNMPQDNPGLDDFAHIGLITDLLD